MEGVQSEPCSELREPQPTKLVNVETADELHILETILLHWRSDPEFTIVLASHFRDPEFNKWAAQYPDSETPAVFKMIEDYVPGKDQSKLIKSLLEADLSGRLKAGPYFTPWQESWYQVCNTAEWEAAKDLLYEDGILSQGSAGFLDCALVLIAERLLQKYTKDLRYWGSRALDKAQREAKNECTNRYREILRSFHHAKEDVCPRFYRFLLRLDLRDKSDGKRGQWVYEDEYRQKYIQLSNLRPRGDCAMGGDEEDEAMDVDSFFGEIKESQSKLAHNPPLSPPTSDYSKCQDCPSTVITQKALEILTKRWHTLSHFEEYTHSLLARDRTAISIFTPPCQSNSENIFDAIIQTIPEEEGRISLSKAILVTSSTFLSKATNPPWLLEWWRTLYSPSSSTSPRITYEIFQTQLISNTFLTTYLTQIFLTPEARKVFLDASIMLVGERLLGILKSGMRKERPWKEHMGKQKRYLAVLSVFRERGIKVDGSWMSYLLDSM